MSTTDILSQYTTIAFKEQGRSVKTDNMLYPIKPCPLRGGCSAGMREGVMGREEGGGEEGREEGGARRSAAGRHCTVTLREATQKAIATSTQQ